MRVTMWWLSHSLHCQTVCPLLKQIYHLLRSQQLPNLYYFLCIGGDKQQKFLHLATSLYAGQPGNCGSISKASRLAMGHAQALLSITNEMQRYTVFFITVNVVCVSGCFSAHHQELKNCTHSVWYMSSLLAATASVGELEPTHASGSTKQV